MKTLKQTKGEIIKGIDYDVCKICNKLISVEEVNDWLKLNKRNLKDVKGNLLVIDEESYDRGRDEFNHKRRYVHKKCMKEVTRGLN